MTRVNRGSSATTCNTKMGPVPGRIGRHAQRPRRTGFTVSEGICISSAPAPQTMQAMSKPGQRNLMPGRMSWETSSEKAAKLRRYVDDEVELSLAALASCDATLIAMRAAQEGIKLTALKWRWPASRTTEACWVNDSVPPGPLSVRVHIRLGQDTSHPFLAGRRAMPILSRWHVKRSSSISSQCRVGSPDADSRCGDPLLPGKANPKRPDSDPGLPDLD